MTSNQDNDDQHLDALFRAYRDACYAPDPSPNFMPLLWQRIEARQRFSIYFGRWARAFVTAAMALTLAMAAYLALPHNTSRALSTGGYVEALAASEQQPTDNLDFIEAAHYNPDSSEY